ncbi:hypothetical protein BC832DRAFT_536354 [Gaertneriomyces semiglobifer]|nr:hypothetical protein BC832DRAFT_536354 [Gaertneriomyces semiglobifer]
MSSPVELSTRMAALATWRSFTTAAVAQLAALSFVRRGSALILGKAVPQFAYAPSTMLTFGYSADQVFSVLNTVGGFGKLCLLIIGVVNFILIAATAFNLSILTSVGLQSSGFAKSPVNQINLLPFAAAALHVLENALFILSIVSSSRALTSLAGTLSIFRDLAGLAALIVVFVSVPLFLAHWSKSIGRDGRQRVQIVKKAE